ncbi:MAG: SGNH/GDSL hydrolase family protein [Endomicrobiales bacterium]|nr:SGNH/GDSL hydrolase family protein [Endomicrobiales bacterium]
MQRFRVSENIFLGWEYDPDHYSENDAGHRVNSRGLVDKEYPLEKGKNTYRIVVLGDSVTEQGWYAKHLEKLLNESGLPKRFEVWNCGVGGYSVMQYYYLLRDKALAFHPDMVMIGFCLNDFMLMPVVSMGEDGEFIVYRNPFSFRKEKDPAVKLNKTLFFHSNAYRYIVFALARCSLKDQEVENGDDRKIANLALEKIMTLTEEKRIPMLAVILPYLKSKYDDTEKSQYESMKDLLGSKGITFVDLHGSFENIDDVSWRKSPADHIHPSERGHRIIGRKIYDYMMKDRSEWLKTYVE